MLVRRTLPFIALSSTLWLLGCGEVRVVDARSGEQDDHVPPSPPSGPCQLTFALPFGGVGRGLEVSNDGRTVSSLSATEMLQGSVGRVGGRWYFEVTVDTLADGVWWAQNIGIGTPDGIRTMGGSSGGLSALLNSGGSLMPGFGSPEPFFGEAFGTGDVIGVAADLDEGRVFFSRNGVWLNAGDPLQGTRGVPIIVLPGVDAYYPAVGVSEGDTLTINLSGDFVHAIPAGYAPFAAGLTGDEDGHCIDVGAGGMPASPAPVQATCSAAYEFTSYAAPQGSGEELHVVGIYEPSTGVGGQVDVHIERSGDMTLALTAYVATSFRVTVAPGANLGRIVLSSYEPSSVDAPLGVTVSSHVFEGNGRYLGGGFEWPSSETSELISAVEEETELKLSSFSGCYAGSQFTLTN
ncbi:SPRY domain-containing protein [Chondromyces crocatus]|nr:SPRY domain-containing protein [Chondromyces crocatus]AKT40600.1 uncharacterized protein CMC5_047560 [Chondromyces crocatus]